MPKSRIREQIIKKLVTDEAFEEYINELPDNLIGGLKLKLTYTEQRQPDELILTSTENVTRTVKSNLERDDYSGGKNNINLVKDARLGGIHNED